MYSDYIRDEANDTSIRRAEAMVRAANKTLTALFDDSNGTVTNLNKVTLLYYGADDCGTIWELGKYTPKTYDRNGVGQYLTLSGKNIKTNVNESVTKNSVELSSYTYIQRGIQLAADELINDTSTDKAERNPVVILLTDGSPNRGKVEYNNVDGDYNVGGASLDNVDVGYLTILSGKYYKEQIKNAYSTGEVKFFTIGFGGANNVYHRAILNPTTANINACKNSNNTYAKTLYKYLITDRQARIQKMNQRYETVVSPYTDYSYADGAWVGDMDTQALQDAMNTITQEIVKHYKTEKVLDTEIVVNEDLAPYELTNIEISKKITIDVDDATLANDVFANLPANIKITGTDGKYYINLQAFEDAEKIEITYYEKEDFTPISGGTIVEEDDDDEPTTPGEGNSTSPDAGTNSMETGRGVENTLESSLKEGKVTLFKAKTLIEEGKDETILTKVEEVVEVVEEKTENTDHNDEKDENVGTLVEETINVIEPENIEEKEEELPKVQEGQAEDDKENSVIDDNVTLVEKVENAEEQEESEIPTNGDENTINDEEVIKQDIENETIVIEENNNVIVNEESPNLPVNEQLQL